ncbi:MAG: hypothetical protein QOJ00_245, partial [Actinomycetota bacterium]
MVSGLRQLVERTAEEFEPGVLTMLTAERAVAEWGAIEKIACAAKLRAAARAEEVGLDAEQTVADASGVTAGQARKQTRLHQKLRGKSKTADAFNKGQLSATEAGAIADAVDAAAEAETPLLELKTSGASTAALLSECDRVRRDALDADGTLAARHHQARSLRHWTDSLGMTCLSGRLEPVAGARVIAELERRSDRLFRAQVRAKGEVDTAEQRMADALNDVVNSVDGTSTAKRRGPRTMVQLLVTKAAVDRGRLEPGDKCETANGTPIPLGAVDTALLDSDTSVQEVTFDEVDVRAITSHKRYIPVRLQDALAARGRICAVPGCGRTKGLERDHTEDFAKGGPTCAANLKWLC